MSKCAYYAYMKFIYMKSNDYKIISIIIEMQPIYFKSSKNQFYGVTVQMMVITYIWQFVYCS